MAHADKVVRAPLVNPPPPIQLSPEPFITPNVPVDDTHPVPSTSSQPSIKLTVGLSPNTLVETPKPLEPRGIKKPKVVGSVKKPKFMGGIKKPIVIDAPPPPYVDDGSHDILQEVIAIEREKDEGKLYRRRSMSEKEKEKAPENGTPGKRKKTVSPDDEEDEILALATPAKKERPMTAGPSSFSEKEPSVTPMPAPELSPGSPKGKKEKTAGSSGPNPIAELPKISPKGKEKEVFPPPSRSKNASTAQATPINEKKCKEILKSLLKLPEAAIFAIAVDPERDGCPT